MLSAVAYRGECGGQRLRGCRDLRPAVDNFTVDNALTIQGLVRGIIDRQGCAIEPEAGEHALRVSEEHDLGIRIFVRGLPIAPRGRSVCPNRKSAGKQFLAETGVQKQDDDIDFLAPELDAQAAGLERHCTGRRPPVTATARKEATYVSEANYRGSLLDPGMTATQSAAATCSVQWPFLAPFMELRTATGRSSLPVVLSAATAVSTPTMAVRKAK
jgi:hypothetical protein